MIKVPVLVDFDSRRVIGELIIFGDLPPTPDFVFSLGYWSDGDGYNLLEISLTPDANYKAFLEKK